jgi:hypothetical protein
MGEMIIPADTDVKIAGDLADFRVEVADRLGKLDAGIAERFGKVDAQFAATATELRIIRRLGTWLLGGVFGLVATLITGAATIGWAASAVNSKVEQQGTRLDALEKRLNVMDQKLDTLIGRTTPKASN